MKERVLALFAEKTGYPPGHARSGPRSGSRSGNRYREAGGDVCGYSRGLQHPARRQVEAARFSDAGARRPVRARPAARSRCSGACPATRGTTSRAVTRTCWEHGCCQPHPAPRADPDAASAAQPLQGDRRDARCRMPRAGHARPRRCLQGTVEATQETGSGNPAARSDRGCRYAHGLHQQLADAGPGARRVLAACSRCRA